MPTYISQNPYNGLAGIIPQARQPYTPIQDAAINHMLEVRRTAAKEGLDSNPILDPTSIALGAAGGLAKYGLTKAIPLRNAIKAATQGAVRNTAEDLALGAVAPDVGNIKDYVDYYRALQGSRRIPNIIR